MEDTRIGTSPEMAVTVLDERNHDRSVYRRGRDRLKRDRLRGRLHAKQPGIRPEPEHAVPRCVHGHEALEI